MKTSLSEDTLALEAKSAKSNTVGSDENTLATSSEDFLDARDLLSRSWLCFGTIRSRY
jgi:hypothetical protein